MEKYVTYLFPVIFVAGLVSFLYPGVWPLSYVFGSETNPVFYLKTLASIFIGGGISIYNSGNFLKMVVSSINGLPSISKTSNEQIYVLESYKMKNMEALNQLTQTCIAEKSEEGIKVCSQLAAILFQLDTKRE